MFSRPSGRSGGALLWNLKQPKELQRYSTLFVNESILDINYAELLTPVYQYMIYTVFPHIRPSLE